MCIRDSFCLPGAPAWLARELSAAGLGLSGLAADALVAPVSTAFPMGFSWSFFWAQIARAQE
eukprot:10591739-Lingulodinium_polyedra.AAC.1